MAFSLSDYQMLEEIGRGGFATVYRARQKSLNKVVAIKCLSPLRQQNSEQIVGFKREAETMAALTHDNIISILDYAFFSGTYYIVMEYIEGMTFGAALDGGISEQPSLCVMEKIADALKAAHDRNIIHRDIKPANILISRQGQVKLADFGLAMFPGGVELQTASGSVLGTLCYLAPEALVSPKEVDARVDIFALGCILYRILTGKLPFDGPTVGEISCRILNEKPAPIERQSPLAALTLRCLEKEREKRPSIDEVSRVIRQSVQERYHACTEALIAFVTKGTNRDDRIDDREQPPVPAGDHRKKKGEVLRLRILSAAAATLSIVVLALIPFLVGLYKDNRPELPRIEAINADGTIESARNPASVKGPGGLAKDAPAPLAGTSLDIEVGTIFLTGMSPVDSVLLNGRYVRLKQVGKQRKISAIPGFYRLEIHRNGKTFLSREVELLPYEKLTVDLKSERTGNARDSAHRKK